MRQHWHMARRDFGRVRVHALRGEALQIRVNRLILAREHVPARLGLPSGAFNLLQEQVGHGHALGLTPSDYRRRFSRLSTAA